MIARGQMQLPFAEVLLHDAHGLDEQARHADRVGTDFLEGIDDLTDGLLDAQVGHRVPIVGEDDVDEVFAYVMHITFDCGEDDPALGTGLGARLLHVRLEKSDGLLHHFRGLQHERQLHLPTAEQLPPTTFMPSSRWSLMIARGE